MERYVIRGGREGYDRLLLLARDRWPDTSALFGRAGVGAGMRCVDLGCGGGEVTLELARLVGPTGTATGVDMDDVKLELARTAAEGRRAVNVDFRSLNVNEWNEPGAYDVVYCRFLLHHLRHPVGLLRRMWAAVRPGGVIIVEDADFDGRTCHPANEAFDFFLSVYSRVVERSGGDHAIGRKLYAYFIEAEIPTPNVGLAKALYIDGEAKWLPWTTLEACTEAIISEGIASAVEVQAALAGLAEFTQDPGTLITGPDIFQLWARR